MKNRPEEFKNAGWIRNSTSIIQAEIENIHTFFRKKFTVENAVITQAELIFTADDYCKVYLNGQYLVAGPAPGYVHHYYYMAVDLTDGIKSGDNCLAVHHYYQGLENRVWNSGDGLTGLKALLVIRYENGDTQTIATDESWLCNDCNAYASERKFGYDTQFAEDIDLRLLPDDWTNTDFDDSAWIAPEVVSDYPHCLFQQPTLPLTREVVKPQTISMLGNGHYLVDFGREVVGSTAFTASGKNGQVIEVRHAEELTEDGRARFKMRASCNYQEFITLSGKPAETAEFFDYKSFRYVELLNYPGELTPDKIFVHERFYPFDGAAEMSTSDTTFNAIWNICRTAVRLGTQDSYLDCMSREKGAYLGDARITGLSHLYLTGRSEMLKKVITDFAASAKYCPGLLAVAPGAFHQHIADYSLLFIPLLYEYYRWSGDLEFVNELQSTVCGLLNYFSQYENSDGLLEDFTGKPVMVDWPQNLRDDYDDTGLMGGIIPQSGINTLLNLYYYGTIASTADICKITGEHNKADIFEDKKNRLRQTLKDKFLGKNGFIDAAGSTHVSMHTNALALMYEVVNQDEAVRIIEILKAKRMKCGVYFAFFLLKGLFNYGEVDFAYDLMTCDDIHSWQTMLNDGATTCMEAWGIEQKWNTSLCHPWASAPVYMAAAEIFGLKPGVPGWAEIDFSPKIPEALAQGSICINIPQGKVAVEFHRKNGQPIFAVSAPDNVKIIRNDV